MVKKKTDFQADVEAELELSKKASSTRKRAKKPTSQLPTSDNAQSVSRLNVREGWGIARGVVTKKVKWLVVDRVIANALNLIDGRKGIGKSTVIADIAAAYSNGLDIFRKPLEITMPYVMWLTHEEVYDIDVIPRFRALGGNEDHFIYPKTSGEIRKLSCPSNLAALTQFVKEHQIGLLILDPFTVLKDSNLSSNSTDDMRYYMESIKAAVCSLGCTVLMVRHPRKGTVGSALDQGAGSAQIAAVARAVLRVDENPTNKEQRLFWVVIKNSGVKPLPLNFDFMDTGESFGVIRWLGEQMIDEDEIMEGNKEKCDVYESKDANTILMEILKNGSKWSKDILEEAKEAGIGVRTMWKAKAFLDIKSERRTDAETNKVKSYWLPLNHSAGA